MTGVEMTREGEMRRTVRSTTLDGAGCGGAGTAASATAASATASGASATGGRTRPALRFAAHFVEMLVAMAAGMLLLGPLWRLAAPGVLAYPSAHAAVMATDMTLGMGLWMRIRGHSWRGITEMSGAMVLPFAALVPLYEVGVVGKDALLTGGHVLMVPLMLAAMLLRRDEYTGHHRH